jgi:hypothetical protein
MEMPTDTERVDFNSYLRDVYLSVKKRWLTKLPPSIEKGQQGKNTVEFRVLQDGSVPRDSLKMVLSSEKSDFDSASLQGVRDAHHSIICLLRSRSDTSFCDSRFITIFRFLEIRTELLHG